MTTRSARGRVNLGQRETWRWRRAKPQQLSLGLEVEGEQMALGVEVMAIQLEVEA